MPDSVATLQPGPRTERFLARTHRLLIGGEWVAPLEGGSFDVFDPATGEPIATVAAASARDVDRGVAAAREAFERGPWRALSSASRSRLLWRLADVVIDHADQLAELETIDNGKPLHDTRAVDLPVASELLRYFGGWATKLNGISTAIGDPGEYQSFTLREPIGVVAQIICPTHRLRSVRSVDAHRSRGDLRSVLAVMSYATTDLEEIAALANDSDYGLAASVWTRDLTTAHRLVPLIRAGQVWVNGHHMGGEDLPVAGYRQSGWGRENGREGIEAYTEIKSVAIALKPPGDWLSIGG